MGEIKRINRIKTLKPQKEFLEKWTFNELICRAMNDAGIASEEALAEKMISNKRYISTISIEALKNYTHGKRKYYEEEGARRNKQQKILEAMAEAFVTTANEPQPDIALINRKKDELQPNTASVNREIDKQLNELSEEAKKQIRDRFNWKESIEPISRLLKPIPAQQVGLLVKAYPQLLSIPSHVSQTIFLYSYLNEEHQAYFSTYMRELLDKSHSELPLQYFEIFAIFEKPALEGSYELMDWLSLSQLLISTFPDKENTEDADAFCASLEWLLDQNYREIVKSYLLLDSDIKREMILRIIDQMLVVQKADITYTLTLTSSNEIGK